MLKAPPIDKKNKSRIDRVIDKLKELSPEQTKWIYDGGRGVYLPIYFTYSNTFFDVVKDHTQMADDFALFRDTAIGERFLLNAVQFSAAKNDAEVKMTQSLLFDDKGTRKGFSEFKKDAGSVADTFHDFWFRVEHDNSVRQAVTGEQFRRYRDDVDIYPYWRYLRTTSLHPRDEHLELVDNIYKIGDPDGDKVVPPDGWNCGCGTEQVSDMEVDEDGLKVRSAEESKEDLKLVSPQFRFNPADQGILPKESHTYFEALPNANAGDGELFNISGSPKNSTKLKARGMHNMLEQMNDWKHEYHSTVNTITFQNKALLSNVVFSHRSFTSISKNPQGVEQLAQTVINPDEVWSQWTDADVQRDTLRTYIKGNYCVFTRNGVIMNAYMVDDVDGYRTGLILPSAQDSNMLYQSPILNDKGPGTKTKMFAKSGIDLNILETVDMP